MLMRPQPIPVRRLLGTVSAHCHAAPASRMTARVIGEEERTVRPLTGFHVGKILRADKPRQCFCDR
jgi:hypothetical protein